MRVALLILIGLVAGAASDTARAEQYRWCANYGGGDEGSYNCYFVTLQQCQAAASGLGGFCVPSPFANGRPAAAPVQGQRRKKS